MQQSAINAQPQPAYAAGNAYFTPDTVPKTVPVAAVGVHEVRKMYGIKEEKMLKTCIDGVSTPRTG